MIRILLDAPGFHREIEVGALDELIEAEGLTWTRDGESDGVPCYVPVGAG